MWMSGARFWGSVEIGDEGCAVSCTSEDTFGQENEIKTMVGLISVQIQYKRSSDDR